MKCTRLRACSEREKVCEKAGPCFLYARQGSRSSIVSTGMNPNFHTSKGCISSSWMSSKYMVPSRNVHKHVPPFIQCTNVDAANDVSGHTTVVSVPKKSMLRNSVPIKSDIRSYTSDPDSPATDAQYVLQCQCVNVQGGSRYHTPQTAAPDAW